MPNPEQFKIGNKDGVDVWHCFGDCQRGGDVIEFVKSMTGLDNAHVRFWFAEKFPDRLSLEKGKPATAGENKPPPVPRSPARPTGGPSEVGPSPETPPAETTPAPPSAVTAAEPLPPLRFHLNLDPSVPYLRERGLTPATIERFGLGLCRKGVLASYVAIPIYDYPAGHLVAYLGRWPGQDFDEAAGRPRYRWPKGFAASRVVYGLKQALEDTEGQPLIVVEGAFKVFHLLQHGFRSVVSCFSASLSDEQAAILVSTGRPVVLLFDGNEAGYKGARNAAGKLITRTFVRVVKLPAGCEADGLAQADLRKLLMI